MVAFEETKNKQGQGHLTAKDGDLSLAELLKLLR